MVEPQSGLPDFEKAYHRTPCGLFAAEAGGKILRVNQTFCRWLDFPSSDLVACRTFQDLLTIGGKIFLQTHLAPLLQVQRSVAEVKLDMRKRDGTAIPMLVNVSRISEFGMEIDEFAVMVVGDRHKYERELISARTRSDEALKAKEVAESALKQADRHKDEFLATLAHELRNPFSAMRTAIDLLTRKRELAKGMVWPLEMLDRQLKQATRLADDLLDVSRIAEGKIEIQKTRVEIGAAIREILESTQARFVGSQPAHTLTVELPDVPIYLYADPVRLAQIVQNLLNNAFRYTPIGGRVGLSVRKESEEVAISVCDSGIGFSHEDLATIFTMFGQAPSGHGRSKGGLGIGLALAQALVLLHDGQLTAASDGIGQGSCFEVRLPVYSANYALPAHAPLLSSSKPSHVAMKGRRVLIVDDNEDAAASLTLLLQIEGHEVKSATSGLGALQMERAFHPEVVVLDLGLPDVDGVEVARRIRSVRGTDVTVVALTGWQAGEESNMPQSQFDAYFVKPVNVNDLLEVIERT